MITEKLILPYIVVSGDLVLHCSFFVLMLLYSGLGGEQSFIARNQKADASKLDDAYRLLFHTHWVCILMCLIQLVIQYMLYDKYKMIRKFCAITKSMLFFYTVCYVQSAIVTELKTLQVQGESIIEPKNGQEVIIILDILFFYFGVFSLIIFNLFLRCFKFKTIR